MKDLSTLKVAIVHDWLIGGGAEKVVLELHRMFPDAPIYTSYCTEEWRQKLDDKVVTGWLQHFGKIRKFMVLGRIWWFGRLKLDAYDLVISSSGNGEAFAVKTGPTTVHVNYCHTPTHYYWRHYDLYMKEPGFGIFNPLVRLALKILVGPLRKWDYRAAQRPDFYIANSSHIQADIKQFYGRDSEVIFPPIDTARFANVSLPKQPYFLVLGRQVPQKRQILAVQACSGLNLPLVVAGNGPENTTLRKAAGSTVRFETSVNDEAVTKYMAEATAFIVPGEDDFGITPIEAMAAGTPVIAYKAGGALDYVVPGQTGEFFDEQTAASLTEALKTFDASKYNSGGIKMAAEQFSVAKFHEKFLSFLKSVLE